MYSDKMLVGNSGDKVYLCDDKVIKEAGVHLDKFKQQMQWLSDCDHPNFIKVKRIEDGLFEMKRYPTWYEKICTQSLDESLQQLHNLIGIVNNFDTKPSDVKTRSYLDKLETRTGFKYEGSLDASSAWGFVHGDLTISNILLSDDFIFIDPRGTEEQDYYDYGKLMQSFVLKYESHIYNERNPNYIKFCNEAEKVMYEWYDEYQLKFFLAVHLLGAVPFFEMNERYELASIFLKKGHEIFDELEIKYSK